MPLIVHPRQCRRLHGGQSVGSKELASSERRVEGDTLPYGRKLRGMAMTEKKDDAKKDEPSGAPTKSNYVAPKFDYAEFVRNLRDSPLFKRLKDS
jgi:hypothetical protein